MVSKCCWTPAQAEDSTTEFGSLMGKVQGIVWDLSHAKSTVDCVWDPTLHLGSLGKRDNGGLGACPCSYIVPPLLEIRASNHC